MKNIYANIIILLLLVFFSNEDDSVNLQITRSKSYVEQTGNLTPLVISVSTEDKNEKVKGVNLVCIVDVSGSMQGARINLVKESLEYLVNLMNDEDSFALVTFSGSAYVVNDFTIMNSNNKNQILRYIKSLSVEWTGTNILSGLQAGLDLIKSDFSTGNKVCSMILLSDGEDNYNYNSVVDKFKNYISSEGKNNYFFTTHCFGYGDDHDAVMMRRIALIRDGGYFYIRKLFMVKDFLLEIYGSLSTVYKVNVNLNVQSNFQIKTVYGIEDMYQASLTNNGINFNTLIIHLVYGRKYQFVLLVNVPQDTQIGTEILKATISPFDKTASYYWDQVYNPYAYEEYIRCISMTYFIKSYNAGKDKGIIIINQGIDWIKSNYDGIKDWLREFYDILEDLKNFKSFGKANILSKLHELKFSKLGIYDDENSYQRKIIDDSYKININQFNVSKFTKQQIIKENYNYYYFYLKDGIAKINDLHFSGNGSSIILYTDKSEEIIMSSITEYTEYYYKFENKARIQTIIDFSRGGKFIYKKDFPFDFYVKIDGKKDITFNIQFLKFEFDKTSDIKEHIFEIKAYVLDIQQIEILKNKNDYLPNNLICNGFYDKGLRIGKVILRKEEISKYLNFNSQNYLYIIVQKNKYLNIIYNYVEGQISFASMDYINSIVPENFYIYSNFSIGQRTPHLYTLNMEPNLGKILRVEFATSGRELDCKILKYQNYLPGTEEFYLDNAQFKITRKNHMGKIYIDITQSTSIETKFDKIIISIFSKNGEHIAGPEIRKLSYIFRYSTYSETGIYNFNDINNKDGEIQVVHSEIDERIFTINFYPLKYSKNDEEYIQEKTRFFLKVYPIIKFRQNIYHSISLFEDSTPEIFMEKIINDETEANFQIQIDPKKNYFFTIYTISNINYEILSYKPQKTYIIPSNIEIKDDNTYEYELLGEQTFELYISEKNVNIYLIIRISDFENGYYGMLYITVKDKIYKSVQPSDNVIIIPNGNCIGEKIKVEITIKEGKKIPYIFSVKMLNHVEINVGENLYFEMLEEYRENLEILVKNNDGNNINIFVQSPTGEFTLEGIDSMESDFFRAKSYNFIEEKSIFFEIKAKTGEFISLYTYIIDSSKKRLISNYEINLYGYLEEKECIYFDENILNINRYQVRIVADKVISIRYNKDTTYEYTEPGVLYLKEFSKKIDKICLDQKNENDIVFFGLQIVDTSNQIIPNLILQPCILGIFYKDILYRDEIRYYRQGLFDFNKNYDLRYIYNVKQIKGEIKVFVSQCDKYPNCKITKTDLESNNKFISLYNINEVFTISKKAKDFRNYSPENNFIYIILCLSDSCEYSFIINKSTSFIDLTRLKKYSSKIYKNNIDKFIISPKNEISQIISIIAYSHSGEIMLNINDNCEDIKHIVFGNIEKIEIPKSCNINHPFEIYVQANIDSIYSIEYSEILDIKYTKIKSNIIHFENIYKEKIIEYTPVKSSYFIKFIPINCEISIKYGENGNKSVPSQYKIYYYNSDSEFEKYYNFTISTDNSDCMIYTYIEELNENFYGILSDQVPYYLSLNKNNKNYRLIYPLPNRNYTPLYRINFFKETHIKISQKILDEKDEEINAVSIKDFKTSSKILEKCNENDICYLIIEIEYKDEPESPIILEIIPKSNNEVPSVLLDNKIKQDFVSLDGPEQQYIVKINKDEEGEIYFNYKYFSGEIIGKLININKKSWKNVHDLPKPNEYLIYDNLKQKISFSKKETNKCNKGCYLFIEVNCIEKLKDKRYYQGLNMDYSIYLKKFNNIVQLRLNEMIIGTISKTLDDHYIEYYSIEVPYSTN